MAIMAATKRGVERVGAKPVDERPVHLDGVDREALQVTQRRISGAKVID